MLAEAVAQGIGPGIAPITSNHPVDQDLDWVLPPWVTTRVDPSSLPGPVSLGLWGGPWPFPSPIIRCSLV